MDMTAEFLEQAVNYLKTAPSRDARREPRVAVEARICIEPSGVQWEDGLPPSVDGWTRDITPSGVCVLCPRPMQVGESFVIHLPRTAATPAPSRILCEVRHCTPETSGTYSIGAVFLQWAA